MQPRRLAIVLLLLAAPVLPVAAANAQAGGCPAEMAWLDSFCIDRWEAHIVGHSPYEVPVSGVAASASGVVPQGYISGTVAESACEAANKRLCTSNEWLRACGGRFGHVYPYGDTYAEGACNNTRAVHPVIEVFGPDATFTGTQMNDPRLNQLPDSLDASGANAQCASGEGVYDMHGNLNEWISDPTGIFRGGFYVEASINGPGCQYRTTAHNVLHHDFSTGFRCCMDAEATRDEVPVVGPIGWLVLATVLAATGAGFWLFERRLV